MDIYEVPFLIYIEKFNYFFPKGIDILDESELFFQKESKLKKGYFLFLQHTPNVYISVDIIPYFELNCCKNIFRINNFFKLQLTIIK